MTAPVDRMSGPFRLAAGIDAARAVSAIAAVAFAVTVLTTWPLWGPRSDPPTFPVIEVLDADFGALLVAAAVAAALRPRFGGPLLLGAVLLAVLGDQTRLQPEVLSLALLAAVAPAGSTGRALARWHLATLWFWSGLHKALSTGWSTGAASFIAGAAGSRDLRPVVAVLLPATEIGLGLLALRRRTWPVLRWVAPAVHVGVTLTLMRIGWNHAVWPWNLALAAVAPLLFRGDDEPLTVPWARAAVAALAAFPALFYVGWMDAYPAHNLYTSNTATARVCSEGRCAAAPFSTWDALDVPLPPEPRLYRRWFDTSCAPGTVLEVTGPRTRLTDPPAVTRHPCPRP